VEEGQEVKRRLATVWLAMILILTPLAIATAPSQLRLFTTTHPAMGTEFTLYLYSADPAVAATASEEVFDEIDRVEQLLSNYRDSSELSRINQNAGAGPVTTDPEMLDFLRQSEHWSEASNGAFDITVRHVFPRTQSLETFVL
jgi:thiamine biosynthesis lipoprotein